MFSQIVRNCRWIDGQINRSIVNVRDKSKQMDEKKKKKKLMKGWIMVIIIQ